MNILMISKTIVFIALVVLLIGWPFKSNHGNKNNNEDDLLKADIQRIIGSMRSYSFKAYVLLDQFNVHRDHKGKTCSLMIGVVNLALCRLMNDIDDQGDINKVHYMLVHYYIEMFEPLLKVVSNEISEYFDELHSDERTSTNERVRLVEQWNMILDAIFGVENAFETFDRSHNVRSNSECVDALIESYFHAYSEIIKEGKLM